MQILYERCAAVDVGKDVIAVAVRLPGEGPEGTGTRATIGVKIGIRARVRIPTRTGFRKPARFPGRNPGAGGRGPDGDAGAGGIRGEPGPGRGDGLPGVSGGASPRPCPIRTGPDGRVIDEFAPWAPDPPGYVD
jgi:hypothetical protein